MVGVPFAQSCFANKTVVYASMPIDTYNEDVFVLVYCFVCVRICVLVFIFQWKMYLLYVLYQSATPSWGRGRVMQLNTSPFDAPGSNALIHHLYYHFFHIFHLYHHQTFTVISTLCFLNSCYGGDGGCKTPGRLKARCCCWWQRQTLMSFCGRCLFIGDQIRQIHH